MLNIQIPIIFINDFIYINIMKKNFNKKLYSIHLVRTDIEINVMLNRFEEFNNKKSIIGIDFEFKKISKESKEIALCQINLENDLEDAYIFIFYPLLLTKQQLDIYIKLLTNRDVVKVIHGGESLDIPYIFDTLFDKNPKLMNDFVSNLYDTKFLCEYYNIINKSSIKCNIYNFLYEMKIIDNIDFLLELEKKIGPIYLIEFDIHKLNNNLIEYALYDVLFLPTLFKKCLKLTNIDLIQEITGIIYYFNKINHYADKINSLNNNFVLINNLKIKLIDIFYYFEYFIIYDSIYNKLIEINYFKKYLQFLLKYIIYKFLFDNYKIYHKNEVINKNILTDKVDIYLLGRKNIKKLINILQKYVKKYL